MVDIDALEPQIWRILSAPDTDLTTISAKRVRRQLLEIEPSLSPAFLKENKEGLDAIISRVFDQVSEGMAGRGSEEVDEMVVAHSRPVTKRKRKVEHERYAEADNDDDDGVSASLSPKKTKKAVKKPERQLTDAEIARQLSSEINGRSRRSTVGNVRMGTNGSSRKSRGIKSSELVETDEETGEKRGGGKAKGGFAKEYALSESLAAVVQIDKLSRPQVVKHLWRYIKENDLQNPQNKKEILCDPNLKAIFHADKVDSFKMNKVLSQHLREIED